MSSENIHLLYSTYIIMAELIQVTTIMVQSNLKE